MQSGVIFSGGSSQYSFAAENARAILTDSPNNWTILDGGLEADITNPEITSTHNNQAIDANVNCETSLPDFTADVTATDNCDASLDISQSPAAGITNLGTTNTVTLTVTDEAGNERGTQFNVAVIDNTDPVPDVTNLSDLTGQCSVSAPTAPTATDNCSGTVTGTTTTTFPITTQGTTIVTWNYDDGNGNTVTQNQNVIIDDITDPTITCIGNQTINLTSEQSTYTVSGTEFDPTATDDNCGIASVENSFNNSTTLSGANLPVGTTTIVWTIIDNDGNSATCSFDVVVNAYTTGIETLKQSGISIYPNPTDGILNFEFANNNIQKISVLNLSGKTIIERTNIQTKENIDLQQFKAGIYIIVIQTNKEVIQKIIMKN
ncbi:MAG: hypothetical protein DRJ10_03535 [Bacteroidetes bacterium]|nr:MAG: hypothetical protein DRJ10_03535 [Bacteroidota bacterium]